MTKERMNKQNIYQIEHLLSVYVCCYFIPNTEQLKSMQNVAQFDKTTSELICTISDLMMSGNPLYPTKTFTFDPI